MFTLTYFIYVNAKYVRILCTVVYVRILCTVVYVRILCIVVAPELPDSLLPIGMVMKQGKTKLMPMVPSKY